MNRIEEPYFNKPDTISLNKPTVSESILSPSDSTPEMSIKIDSQSILILLLFFFLILSVLGINLLNILGNFLQSLSEIFGPLINRFLNALGYSAGTALDKVSDVTADAAKVGIDIADGALNNIGGLLKGSGPNPNDDDGNNPDKKILHLLLLLLHHHHQNLLKNRQKNLLQIVVKIRFKNQLHPINGIGV